MKNGILALLMLGTIAAVVRAESPLPVIEVYKSPTCGCCSKWVEHLKANGFQVNAHDTQDVMSHKQRLGVPPAMGSCHTAEVGGYLVEGHVPAADIKRLLNDRPAARGLVVPAMPMGSPGMEGDRTDRYDVLLVNPDGTTSTYSRY